MAVQQHKALRTYSTNIDDFVLPHGKIEEWRFTPTKLFLPFANLQPEEQRASLQLTADVPGQAKITQEPLKESPAGCVNLPSERLGAVVWNSVNNAHVIELPSGDHSDLPLVINVNDAEGDHISYGHTVIQVPDRSAASLVIYQSQTGQSSDNFEIRVGDDASLTIVFVGVQGDAAVTHSNHGILLGRNASIRHGMINLGGKAVRTNVAVDYSGPGGDAELVGLFFVSAGQHVENRLLVDHDEPHCKSDVNYKGALLGDTTSRDGIARGVWVGDVFIGAKAIGTNTYESNRNLMLNKATRMDSIPNLEINTGVIEGAGHASTTGRFDEEELFYLQSRGIDEIAARQLVVRGFFHDIVHRFNLPKVEEELDDVVFKQLDHAGL